MSVGHGGAWTPSAHYTVGQCGQSCPCCRFEEARHRESSSWFGVCTICARASKKRKRSVDAPLAPRAKRSKPMIDAV